MGRIYWFERDNVLTLAKTFLLIIIMITVKQLLAEKYWISLLSIQG
jgi:hypothetical protein